MVQLDFRSSCVAPGSEASHESLQALAQRDLDTRLGTGHHCGHRSLLLLSAASAMPEDAAIMPAAANGNPEERDDGSEAMPSPQDQPESAGQSGDHAEQLPLPGDGVRAGSAVPPPRAELMGAPPPRAAARPQAPPPQFHQPAAPSQAAGDLRSW